jgi:hypothetical protein
MESTPEWQTLETEHAQHCADGAFDKAAEVRVRQAELLIEHDLPREAADFSVWAGNEWMQHVRMLREGQRIPEADVCYAKAAEAYARATELDPTLADGEGWQAEMERTPKGG